MGVTGLLRQVRFSFTWRGAHDSAQPTLSLPIWSPWTRSSHMWPETVVNAWGVTIAGRASDVHDMLTLSSP